MPVYMVKDDDYTPTLVEADDLACAIDVWRGECEIVDMAREPQSIKRIYDDFVAR